MDMLAARLGMDPAEVRRRNFIASDEFPYTAPTGMQYDSGDYAAALERVLQLSGYAGLREQQRVLRGRGELMGVGIAMSTEASGLGPTTSRSAKPGYESATVRVDPAGRVTVLTGSSPHGQGLQTAFAQLAADDLSVPFEDVEVIHGDTAIVPRGVGTFASRSLVVGGTAVIKASERVREKALQIAGTLLHIDSEHVVLDSGRFMAEDIPDRWVSWADVGREAYQARQMPQDMERGLEATAFWEPSEYTFPFGASVAVVRVDPDTGEVKLQDYFLVDDCGTVVNPMLLEGQIHGSLAQGIGPALIEQAVYDQAGQLLTGSFLDYAMPMAEEFPLFQLDRTYTPTPHNPMGAKGGAETSTNAATGAVANAVVDALSHLGVTHIDIPITPEKVWNVLRERAGKR